MTILSEDFIKADNAAIGHNYSFTDVTGDLQNVSNAAKVINTDVSNISRLESDLATVNHECEIRVKTLSTNGGSTNAQVGAIVGFSSSAATFYQVYIIRYLGASWLQMVKSVAGTPSNLGTQLDLSEFTLPLRLKFRRDVIAGNARLRAFINDVLVKEVTDSSSPIITGTRVGLYGLHGGIAPGTTSIDLLTAQDVFNGGTFAASLTNATKVTLSNSAASGGTAPYSYAWQQRVTVNGVAGSWVTLSTQSSVADTVAPTNYVADVVPGRTYDFRVLTTATGGATDLSASVNIVVPAKKIINANRIKETTLTTGTGKITLAGAASGFNAFSAACADGQRVRYMLTSGTSWERGIGSFGAGGYLNREIVLESTNGNAAITLSGTSTVWLDAPASWLNGVPANVLDFGAKFDAVRVADGAITSGDATFTSASSAFTSANIGQRIVIAGAGAGGIVLEANIASINSGTSVELDTLAGTTVASAGVACYGTDNAQAFQEAIDAVAAGGGGTVSVPPGSYVIGKQVDVKSGVKLIGASNGVLETNGIRDGGSYPLPGAYGSWIFNTYGPGVSPSDGDNASNATFIVRQNSTMRGFSGYYPLISTANADPGEYPYFIRMHERGCVVESIELLNPPYGILCRNVSVGLIQNISGQPLKIGVELTNCFDIIRLDNIHWNPWFNYPTGVYEWQVANGIGFKFNIVEFVQATKLFGYGLKRFFWFANVDFYGMFYGCSADTCASAIYIHAVTKLLLSNFFGITCGETIGIEPGGSGVITVSGCEFTTGILSHNAGQLNVSGTTFDTAGIVSTGGTLVATGNTFLSTTGVAIDVQAGTTSALVVGNLSAKTGGGAFANAISTAATFANNHEG